jgi:hypothetical protein
MSKLIESGGEPFAMLIEGEHGMYLVPPIVVDSDGEVIEGREVLAAMGVAGVTAAVLSGHTPGGAEVRHPLLLGRTAADLAAIDQHMAEISRQLGVPIGPPE